MIIIAQQKSKSKQIFDSDITIISIINKIDKIIDLGRNTGEVLNRGSDHRVQDNFFPIIFFKYTPTNKKDIRVS